MAPVVPVAVDVAGAEGVVSDGLEASVAAAGVAEVVEGCEDAVVPAGLFPNNPPVGAAG